MGVRQHPVKKREGEKGVSERGVNADPQPNYLENPYDLDEPHWDDDVGSLWFGHVDSEAVHHGQY